MIRTALLPLLWFPVAFILILVNTVLLTRSPLLYSQTKSPLIAFARESPEIIHTEIIAEDARAIILKNFFESYSAPLGEFAEQFIKTADVNNLDWKLLPAISMCESLGGKRIPYSSGYNPFGVAVFTGQKTGKEFTDWNHAIEWTGSLIKQKYQDKGLTDVLSMGARWAPPSVLNGNSWANCVQSFINKIL